MKNTKRKSIFTFYIIPSSDKKGWHTAFCFELGLIREGKDPLKLKNRINKLAFEYYKSIVQHKLSDDLLNQELPKKYMKIAKDIELQELQEKWEKILNFMWRRRARNGEFYAERALV